MSYAWPVSPKAYDITQHPIYYRNRGLPFANWIPKLGWALREFSQNPEIAWKTKGPLECLAIRHVCPVNGTVMINVSRNKASVTAHKKAVLGKARIFGQIQPRDPRWQSGIETDWFDWGFDFEGSEEAEVWGRAGTFKSRINLSSQKLSDFHLMFLMPASVKSAIQPFPVWRWELGS